MAAHEVVRSDFHEHDGRMRLREARKFEAHHIFSRRAADGEVGDFACRMCGAHALEEIEGESARRIARSDAERQAVAGDRQAHVRTRRWRRNSEQQRTCCGKRERNRRTGTFHEAAAFRPVIATTPPTASVMTVSQRCQTAGLCVTITMV